MPVVSVAMVHSAGKVRGDEIHELDSSFETAAVTGVDSNKHLVDAVRVGDEWLKRAPFFRTVTGITLIPEWFSNALQIQPTPP